MHTTVFSGAIVGIGGLVVEVEVDIARGIPCFSIVGLPNTAVRESRERVTAALKNSGWDFPLERITVNLAPADLKKEGSAFDLAIAIGILVSSHQAGASGTLHDKTLFLGELALDGTLRRIPGVLPILLHARETGFARAIIPDMCYGESLAAEGIEVVACRGLRDAFAVCFGEDALPEGEGEGVVCRTKAVGATVPAMPAHEDQHDMSDVRGQASVKRALLVAAAGGHHALMVGPPGAGKTMLARRFVSILPPLSPRAALETTMIYSVVGILNGRGVMAHPPLRAPHHSASDAGLIGGGNVPRPGEVTLAHNGVLFLDELPEFRRHVLETLREPLEDGRITISRARSAVTFPARFQLVAAMNPCPCGYRGSKARQCKCSPLQIEKYLAKISGPLLDRISIHATVRPVDLDAFAGDAVPETSASLRERATSARERQRHRFRDLPGVESNATIPERHFRTICPMTADAEVLLMKALARLRISARARSHIIRVARTIADLEGAETIDAKHVAEGVQYRAARMV